MSFSLVNKHYQQLMMVQCAGGKGCERYSQGQLKTDGETDHSIASILATG